MKDRRRSNTFQFEVDPFADKAEGIRKNYHEVFLLKKFLQIPHNQCLNINYYDLYFTVIKDRDEEEIVNVEYESNESDYNNDEDFYIPNHFDGRTMTM